MRVGAEGKAGALVRRRAQKTPVHVEAPRVAVYFQGDTVGDRCVHHLVHLHGVAGPGQQQAPGKVANNGRAWMFDGADKFFGRRLFRHLHAVMNGGDNKLEGAQDFRTIIQRTIAEDIRFDSLKDADARQARVQPVYFLMLIADALRGQAVGDGRGLAVVRDNDIRISQPPRLQRHFLQAVDPVAPM